MWMCCRFYEIKVTLMKMWTITGLDRCVFIKPRREYNEISNVNGQRWRRNSWLKYQVQLEGQRMICPNCYTGENLRVVCRVNHSCWEKCLKKCLLHNFIRNLYYWVTATNAITEEDKAICFILCPICFSHFKWSIQWSLKKSYCEHSFNVSHNKNI